MLPKVRAGSWLKILKKKEYQLHDTHSLQKIIKSLRRRRYLIFLLLSFLAGCLLTGFLLYQPRPGAVAILDWKAGCNPASIINFLSNE